jgi:hypothetical protein
MTPKYGVSFMFSSKNVSKISKMDDDQSSILNLKADQSKTPKVKGEKKARFGEPSDHNLSIEGQEDLRQFVPNDDLHFQK